MPSHPAHELYDGSCELLAAAQSMHASARRPDCAQAIPATLGCLGATLDQLAHASHELAEEMRRTRTLSDRPSTAAMQALDRLTESLRAARDLCEIARAKAAIAAAQPARATNSATIAP